MTEPRDQELEDHLAGKSSVSRLYRQLPDEMPAPELDARIRQAARQELASRRSRWLLPLSAAAVLMLSVGVLLRMQQEGVTPLPGGEIPPPAVPHGTLRAPVESAPAAVESEAAASASPEVRDATVAPEPAMAPEPAQEMKREKAQVQSTDEVYAAPRQDAAAPPAAVPAAGAASQAEQEYALMREAEDWIERIRRLRVEGRDSEAETEIEAFRERYPDYSLPEDLRSEDH